MILQKEYKRKAGIVSSTFIDNIDKIDTGVYDNGISFCNVYKKNRKKEDDFETIEVVGFDVYVLNDEGKTLRAIRETR